MDSDLNNNVVGVILAGGEGKRLRPLTYYFQKCMIPIGSEQKPLLEYILLHLRKHGINSVKLLVGYKHEQIVNYFNSGSRFGLDIEYFHDDPSMGGSGGALLNAATKDAFKIANILLVYYGDILSNLNLSALIKQHIDSDACATIAVTNKYEVPVGVADIDGTTVKSWIEKPEISIYAGIGVVAFDIEVLDDLNKFDTGANQMDIMGDLIPYLVQHGKKVDAYLTDAFWYDVGSTEKYEKIDNGLIDKLFKE